MPETQQLERVVWPRLGDDGEPCAECGAPLAHDQRYCLHCGRRRAAARIPFLDILREEYGQAREREAAAGKGEEAKDDSERANPQVAWAIVGGFLLMLIGIGVLIGLIAGGGKSTVAGTPQIVTAGGTGTGGTEASAAGFKSDWPSGKDGWTVQLETLPKSSTLPTSVAQAKTDATSKGAPAVGALDSDRFGSLTPGKYVIYSGVFNKKKQAQDALGKLKKSFPGATVIHVSGSNNGSGIANTGGDPNAFSGKVKRAVVDRSQLQFLQNLPPGQYQKYSRKLPDETILPGTPPPKDNKAPGAGTSGTVIK